MSEAAYVNLEIEGAVGEITFFHPAHNSLPGDMLGKLAATIEDAGNHPDIKVILLKSGGDRTFCAGASFNELVAIDNFEDGKKFFMGFANVINACRKCPKVIIGRVQGKAVGGGVGLVAAVDYCFATKYAAVKLSELTIGIGPFVVGPAVERKIGVSCFAGLAINATEFQTAEWAFEKGLFHEIFETAEEMDEGIRELTQNLVSTSHTAQQLIKKVTWEGTGHWDRLLEERAELSGRLVVSDFTKKVLEKYKTVS